MAGLPNKIKLTTVVDGKEVCAGTIFCHGSSITFMYDDDYCAMQKSYDLFPCLPRTAFGPFHFKGLGPFSDSAPDRWGRTLINRSLKRNKVSEIEYLLNVDDESRQGCLRYYVEGEAQAANSNIPYVIDLPELLTIADDVVMQNEITDECAARLFHATGSLGGARPKACVRDGEELYVAKFPKPAGDAWDIMGWEFVTLKLASLFGISVSKAKIVSVTDAQKRSRNVLLTRRFDRDESQNRVHFMSAMTALQTADGEGGDWQDLAEMTLELGADLRQLWKRAIFGTAIGNLDNHLRNHAYLMNGCSWELSPAYDMNPEPIDSSADVFQLSLFGECELSVDAFTTPKALELFKITQDECAAELAKLNNVIKGAVKVAHKVKLDAKSIDKIAPRFQEL